MAEKEEKLVDLDENLTNTDEMFDAGDPDDMAEFMDLLNSIDMGGDEFGIDTDEGLDEKAEDNSEDELGADFSEELSSLDITDMEQQLEEVAGEETDVEGMMAELGLDSLNIEPEEKIDFSDDVSSFVPEEDAGIMDFLDSVGTEQVAVDDALAAADAMIASDNNMSMEDEAADEGAGEIASFLENLDGEEAVEEEQEKQPGFFNKMFHKEPTEEEMIQQMQDEADEQAWEAQQAAEAEEKKQKKLEKKQEKLAAAEAKKQAKKEKKDAKAAAKKEKAQAKLEAKRAENGNIPRSMIVPKKPVFVFCLVGIALSVLFIVFINYRFYNASISEAKEQFIHRQYKDAYEAVIGLEVKAKDEKFLEQVKVIRIVDKDLEAYKNYVKVEDYERALISLVNGIGKYDMQKERAKELSLEKEMYSLYEELIQEVSVRFEITAQDALNMYKMTDKTEYDKKIMKIARDAALRDGILEPVVIQGQ